MRMAAEGWIGGMPVGGPKRWLRGALMGCPRLHPRSGRGLARILSALRGKRYRIGDPIMITLSSERYGPEHMLITIRRGRLPAYRSY
jgi:hypothetical protein